MMVMGGMYLDGVYLDGVYLDGVYLADGGDFPDMMDVELKDVEARADEDY